MSYQNTQQQYAAYKAAHQTTDNKTQQVVMIYDGIMRVIYQAKQAILNQNIQERYNLLEKASQVILGLQASLDFDNGGEVAQILNSYYNAIYTKVHIINHSNSIADCEALIEDIKAMRSAWQYVLETTTDLTAENSTPAVANDSSLQVSI